MVDGTFDRILVTGASGFVGSNFVFRLNGARRKGQKIFALIRNGGPEDVLGRFERQTVVPIDRQFVEVIAGDLCDPQFVWSVIRKTRPTLILNFASQAIVRDSLKSPVYTMANNVMGTTYLLEACREILGVNSTIFFHQSTDKVYGSGKMIDESFPMVATCPYSASKIGAEALVRSYSDSFGMKCVVARPANIYGEGDMNFSRVIPGTILRAFNGERVPVYADARSRMRQYVYIADLYQWVMWAIRNVMGSSLDFFSFNVLPGETFAKGKGSSDGSMTAEKVILKTLGAISKQQKSRFTPKYESGGIGIKEIECQKLTSKYLNEMREAVGGEQGQIVFPSTFDEMIGSVVSWYWAYFSSL